MNRGQQAKLLLGKLFKREEDTCFGVKGKEETI